MDFIARFKKAYRDGMGARWLLVHGNDESLPSLDDYGRNIRVLYELKHAAEREARLLSRGRRDGDHVYVVDLKEQD